MSPPVGFAVALYTVADERGEGQVGLRRALLAVSAATGAFAIVPALIVAVVRDDLTTDGLSSSTRADDGALLGFALLFWIVAVMRFRWEEA